MGDPQSDSRAKETYPGARYFREFISKMRKDEDAGKFEHLEDYPYDIEVDKELGLRLFHAGINPYDGEHFRHQIYLVVLSSGKASKLCRPDIVVASSLTLQWTKRGDLCNALLLSIKSYGQCTFAWCGDKSRNKCGWCGHNMKTLLWRNDHWKWKVYSRRRVLKEGEKHCCKWNALMKKYQCCKCDDPDNAFMSPLDREESAAMPQSVLPATLDGKDKSNLDTALVSTSASSTNPKNSASTSLDGPHIINNYNLYLCPGESGHGLPNGARPLPVNTSQGLIEFFSQMPQAFPPHRPHMPTGPQGQVIGEIEDFPGPPFDRPNATGKGEGEGKDREKDKDGEDTPVHYTSYTSPKVEDDVSEVGVSDAAKLAALMAGLEFDKDGQN